MVGGDSNANDLTFQEAALKLWNLRASGVEGCFMTRATYLGKAEKVFECPHISAWWSGCVLFDGCDRPYQITGRDIKSNDWRIVKP